MSPSAEPTLHALALAHEAGARDPWQQPETVIAWLSLRGDETVVDLGAGTGYFSVRLARALPRGEVYAVERDPGLRAALAATARAQALPLRVTEQVPPQADLVWACNVARHLPLSLAPSAARLVVVDFDPLRAPAGPEVPPQASLLSAEEVVAQVAERYALVETRALPRQYYLAFRRRA